MNNTAAAQGDRALRVDLNCDLGEGFGAYEFGQDEALLAIVSSANIACGFHAGDPHTMRRTVNLCLQAGVAIGAHPGLPDRLGFGRKEMASAVIRAVEAVDPKLILYAQSGSLLYREAGLAGLNAASEVFADRRYQSDGALVSRHLPDALVEEEEEAVRQAVRMAVHGEVRIQTGSVIPVQADTLCVHGDGKTAVKLAESIRRGLIENQVEIVSPDRFI